MEKFQDQKLCGQNEKIIICSNYNLHSYVHKLCTLGKNSESQIGILQLWKFFLFSLTWMSMVPNDPKTYTKLTAQLFLGLN